jgi:hypothetical protein
LGVGLKVGDPCLIAGFAAVDLRVRRGGPVYPDAVAPHLPLLLTGNRSRG